MVFKLIGLGLDAVLALAGALTKYITKPMPLKITDDFGREKYFTITFTTPHKVDKVKVIGLVLVGNIDETLVKRIEQDLIVEIAKTTNMLLEEIMKKKVEKGKYQHKGFKMENSQIEHPYIEEFAANFVVLMFQDKEIRAYVKQVVKLKGMKWSEETDNMLANIKAEKYQGEYVIKYWEKGLFGENDWIIPYEAIKIWQKVYPFTDPDTIDIAKELYDSYHLKKANNTKENRKRFSEAQNLMKQYIKDKSKKK
ncbi:MAG: hypothetical protein ACTSSH_04510 [Candidatus Heimdallarchaeota archaeon]